MKFTASVKRSVSISVKDLYSQKEADQILTDLLATLRQEVLNK